MVLEIFILITSILNLVVLLLVIHRFRSFLLTHPENAQLKKLARKIVKPKGSVILPETESDIAKQKNPDFYENIKEGY